MLKAVQCAPVWHTHTHTHSSKIIAVPQIPEARMRHCSIQRLKKKTTYRGFICCSEISRWSKDKYNMSVSFSTAHRRGTRFSHLVSLSNAGWLQPDVQPGFTDGSVDNFIIRNTDFTSVQCTQVKDCICDTWVFLELISHIDSHLILKVNLGYFLLFWKA